MKKNTFEVIGLAQIYSQHTLLQETVGCENLLKLMVKHSPGEIASLSHDFVILGHLSSNRFSHYSGPVVYSSGYRGHFIKFQNYIKNLIPKFEPELLSTALSS